MKKKYWDDYRQEVPFENIRLVFSNKKYNKVIKIKTKLIPIIIDYGKSHAVFNGKHFGLINLFQGNSCHDIICLLISPPLVVYLSVSPNIFACFSYYVCLFLLLFLVVSNI